MHTKFSVSEACVCHFIYSSGNNISNELNGKCWFLFAYYVLLTLFVATKVLKGNAKEIWTITCFSLQTQSKRRLQRPWNILFCLHVRRYMQRSNGLFNDKKIL
jgi:hypothetical protein